jgi:hypothetical protein
MLGCHGFKQTRPEPAETAIAERSFNLEFPEFLQVDIEIGKCIPTDFQESLRQEIGSE